MEVILQKSNKPDKKYMVILGGKTIHFGQAGASDFLHHKSEERKNRYINRHKKNEYWDNPKTAGFWAVHLLWNKPTLVESIADIEKRFNLHIKFIY